jgi:putative Mg2+ transporter-C (MgtC) family protein
MTMINIYSVLDNPNNLQLLVSALLGALVGLERELAGKDPSLRTFSLICLGSCAFSLISIEVGMLRSMSDPARIAAQIVVGIGFLGAGTIYRSRNGVSGLTTAALMWVTAAIGMTVGFGRVADAISITIIAIGVTFSLSSVHRIIAYLRREQTPQQKKQAQEKSD